MIPPPDSLEAALRAVPLRGQRMDGIWEAAQEGRIYQATEPDFPALAAASREWIRMLLPPKYTGHADTFDHADAYNECLDDVAGRLGLS